MMKKLGTTIFAFALSVLGALQAATTGSYLKSAQTLSPSGSEQTLQVTLTKSYDPDEKTYDSDCGVYYVKVKVSRGKTCSIWCDGKSNESMVLNEDYDYDDEKLMASFNSYSRDGEELFVLTYDCWDMEEDPSAGWFYFYVDGDVGDTCTIHYTTTAIDGEAWEGEEPPPPLGTEANPEKITLTESSKTFSGTFIEGDYYYYFTAQAGRAYRFAIQNSTEANPIDVSCVDATCEYTDLTVYSSSESSEDLQPSLEIRTTTAGTVYLRVSGETGSFKMTGVMLRNRSIDVHDVTELNEGNGYAANFVPGHLSAEPDVWDPIVDEMLFKADLEQGERAIFEVSNAATNLTMYLYDKNGTVLDMNQGRGGLDPYIAYVATASGTYYVGVCQTDLEAGMEALGSEVTLQMKKPGPAVDGDPDEWDAADDTIAGATTIGATVANDNVDINVDAGHGPHRLSFTDWEDIYKIDCQNGVSYKIGTTTEVSTPYSIYGEIFTVNVKDSKETSVTKGVVSEGGIVFTAKASQTYYVRVYVNEGKGREYPAYMLRSVAYVPGQKLGYMTVNIKGPASAYWTYGNPKGTDKTQRKGGTRVLTWGNNTVTFATVKGFSHPEKVTHVMTGDEAEDTLLGVYNDTSDPLDDYPSGTYSGKKKYAPVTLKPSAKGVSVERTLYVEDSADWYSFAGAVGSYYKFTLQDVVGTPRVRVFGPNSTNAPCERVLCPDTNTVYQILVATKGTYYVVVDHEEENKEDWQDSSYTLVATSVNVGSIKFAKTALSVKENAAYAELTVKRTAKEGRVRVAYSTVAGTAKPKEDYYPTSGELEWANGDSKDKPIRVRLVPDEVPTLESNKTFTVELKAIEEGELDADEYLASIATPSATVTLTEVSKSAPGTISVTDGSVEGESLEFAAKKPAFTVTAGDTLTLTLSRTDGGNGKVAVTVQTAKGTAVENTDFVELNQVVEWADGDVEDKKVEIVTVEQENQYKESKAFTVKVAAYTPKGAKDYAKAKIGTSSVSVTVKNNLVASSAETYAKTLTKAGGIALKAGKAGQWYIDEASGDLKSVPAEKAGAKAEMTFTLTGPGLFIAQPYGDGGTFTCKVGKEAEVDCSNGDEYVRLVGSGSTTLKFTLVATGAGATAGFDGSSGAPYVWIPFGSVAPTPADKARVLPSDAGVPLVWDVPAEAAEHGIRYRVSFADNKSLKEATEIEAADATTLSPALVANKTWYWRVDYGREVEGGEVEWVTAKTVWTFSTTAAGAAQALVADDQRDALGAEIVAGTPATLMQGVKASIEFASDADGAAFSVASGKLPDGVKLAQDKATKKWIASGVPTKAGSYAALVQAKSGKVAGTTAALAFEVLPTTLAAGTFAGVFAADGTDDAPIATNGCARLASVTFTSTAAGKLSAKVLIAGKTYTFAGTGFDAVSNYDAELGRSVYSATLTQVQKVGKVAYTNLLDVSVENAAEDDLEVLGRDPAVQARLTMAALPDAKGGGAQYNLAYAGVLRRNNAKVASVLEAMQDFTGYYTLALCPPKGTSAVQDGVPSGYGYLTLTLNAKGSAKVAGALADGTAVSFSAPPALLGNLANEDDARSCELIVPVYVAKGSAVFGGELRLVWETLDAEVPVLDPSCLLAWYNDDPASTYGGKTGFALGIVPAGGWYNTVFNLQAHYLTSQFELTVSDELPEELLATGYQFAANAVPTALGVTLTGDSISVDKKSLVKEDGSKTRYNFMASVNPWDVKMTFKRATGVLTGTFSVWTDNGTKQAEIKSLKHAGVLLLSRSDETSALLPDTAWTAGYYLAPTTLKTGTKSRKWNASLPFCITEHPGMEVFDGIDNWGNN